MMEFNYRTSKEEEADRLVARAKMLLEKILTDEWNKSKDISKLKQSIEALFSKDAN